MSKRDKLKAKKIVKVIVPVADRIFANKKIKNISLKAAKKFQQRYAPHGDTIKAVLPRKYAGPWKFMLDSPKLTKSTKQKVYVSGWLAPLFDHTNPIKLRLLTPAGDYTKLTYGISRSDVAATMRTKYRRVFDDACGFGSSIEIVKDGEYVIEVEVDGEWQKVCKFDLEYDLDLLVKDVTNPYLAVNAAEHQVLVDTKKKYFYEDELEQRYVPDKNDPKLVAFYLPQFHPFKENDEWWGKGFTEWTNVASATPRFIGHEQPKLPTDLGFYDLRYEENILKQIQLAKDHGVHAFCFYYYWFSGKRLLEKPLDSFLKHKEWDFNFMICWANENWTRRWDGHEEDVLIKQEHKQEDPLEFIKDVEPILLDERYMRVDGKPVLMVYRAHDLDTADSYSKIWREYFKEKHGLDLHLVAVQSFSNDTPTTYGFDRGLEFVPLSIASTLKEPIPTYKIGDKTLDFQYTGIAYDYRKIALNFQNVAREKDNMYKSIMPSWDNDARKKGSGGVFFDSNPDLYGRWLEKIIERNGKSNNLTDNLLFVNAWNEWAEGAYLEPDTMYGHGFLNRTAETLAKYSDNPDNRKNFPLYGIERKSSTKLAVVVHLYYADLWPTFENKLKNLQDVDYDLFVTIPAKNEFIKKDIASFKKNAHVIVVPNRGRDVLPFVHLARRLKDVGYEYVLKVHSKKSMHRDDGNLWMEDMLEKLIPEKLDVNNLISALEDSSTGIVGPAGHYISLDSYFGSNKDKITAIVDELFDIKTSDKVVKNIGRFGFFAGTMFWARLDSISPVLDQFYQPSDFESERGQIDGTFAHAIERVLSLVPQINEQKLYILEDGRVRELPSDPTENFDNYTFAQNE